MRTRDLKRFSTYARKLANGESVKVLRTVHEQKEAGPYTRRTKIVEATPEEQKLWKQLADELDEFLEKRK